MDFPQPIIDSVYRKSCDGDSRPYGKLVANWGWWEPGTSNGGLKITPEQQAEEQSRPGRFPPLKGACMTGNGVCRTGGNAKNKLRPFLDGAFYVSRIPLEFLLT